MRGYVETGLGLVHYERTGRGPAVLLWPAAGRSARMFRGLVGELAGSFETVAVDPPGFGRSDLLPPDATIEDLARLCVEVLDGLGLARAHVYGLHTGNKVATALAVARPDRVGRVILAGQSHSLIPDRETRNAGIRHLIGSYVDLAATDPMGADMRAGRVARAARLIAAADPATGSHPGLGGDILDHVLDELEARSTGALYRANFGYDLEAGFRALAVPALVLEIATAAETRDVGLQGPAVQALIAGSTLHTMTVPDGDALTLEDRPAELAAVIAGFLRP